MDEKTITRGIALFSAQQFVTGVAKAKLPICATDWTVIDVARKFEKYLKEG